jgi:hypothetical protein
MHKNVMLARRFNTCSRADPFMTSARAWRPDWRPLAEWSALDHDCPTLAAATPNEVFWPGQSHRDHMRKIAKQAQAQIKGSSKKDSET